MIRRVLAGCAAAALLSAGAAAPAVAQEDRGGDGPGIPVALAEDATRYILWEVALLQELGAFTPDFGDRFEQIHEAFAPWPAADRDQTIELLRAVDIELARRAGVVNLFPAGFNGDLGFSVRQMPEPWEERLEQGDVAFISGFEYVGALEKLLFDLAASDVQGFDAGDASNEAARIALLEAELVDALEELADAQQMTALLGLEVADLRVAVADLAENTGLPVQTGDAAPWRLILIAAVAGVLVLSLTIIVVARRRKTSGNSPAGTVEVIEAHRLLTNARSEVEIAEIVTAAATKLASGAEATLLRRVPEGFRVAGTTPIITMSAVSRITDTGQPLLAELHGDPLWPTRTVAVAGVPLVHVGQVIGAIVVCRDAPQPFQLDVRERLELLAPAVGGALVTADELNSMETMAMVDGLTALGNRRRLDGDLETTLAAALTADLPVGFAMIDVDHFKIFNDTHGHSAGDQVLQLVARAIESCVRESDVVYRYGGEEFSMLLPDATPADALAVSERVRAAVEALEIPGEALQPAGKLTVSVGVATLESGDADGLKDRADAALYRAKAAGRNRVAIG